MAYLIDGYNLLHAMGLLSHRVGPTGLEKARRSLLGLLGGSYKDEAPTVTVVFDAAGAPPGAPEETEANGIQVRFARGNQQADDLIEQLIHHDSAPRHLTVVSDDHRIRDAARHRHCIVLGCGDFLDGLRRHRREHASPAEPGEPKPQSLSAQETERWLAEFADLQDSAELRELSDPLEFLEGDGI